MLFLLSLLVVGSLSARRAWIEMMIKLYTDEGWPVALRKESVDRNGFLWPARLRQNCRSPQGERG